jgi:predicted ester cyclase
MNSILFTTERLDPAAGTKQPLPGFAEQYTDIVDYILKITHEIWEERGIGVIYDTYTEGITLHTGATSIHGINAVVGGTMETLHAFPDRRLVGEAVVWSGAGESKFYTSHRIASTATNLGASAYGPATGKKVFFRTIADCVVAANRIGEEWLVRDNLHLVQQLGFDPVSLAKQSGKYRGKPLPHVPLVAENRMGQHRPERSDAGPSDSGTLLYNLFQTVWNGRNFHRVADYYHPTAAVHSICDQTYRGVPAIQGLLINLFASLPQASVQVERITCNTGPEADTVAVRWRLTGLHQGNGFFGPASGKPVNIWVSATFWCPAARLSRNGLCLTRSTCCARSTRSRPRLARRWLNPPVRPRRRCTWTTNGWWLLLSPLPTRPLREKDRSTTWSTNISRPT